MSIDRIFEAFYRRYRRTCVELWLIISGLGIVFLAWPAQHATQFVLWGLHPDHDPAALAVIMAVGAVITVVVMVWTARGPFRPVIQFLRDEPVVPEAVWHAAVREIPRVAATATAAYCVVGNTTAVIVAGRHRDFSALEYVGAWIAESLITVTAAFFYILIWEVAYRPVLRDVDPLLPLSFAPSPHWLTLTRRSGIAITSVMLYTGIVAASIVSGFEDRENRMWAAVLATLFAAATFGGSITALVSHSIFSRASDLKAALVRIGEGDFDVRVALRMGDELDAAGRALNAMAVRLKRHDADLRESRARLTSVENDERRRIERDLRVGVDRRLKSLTEQMQGVERLLGPELQPACAEVRSSLTAARTEIRYLASGIFPRALVTDGLGAALRDASARSGLGVSLDVDSIGRLPGEVEAAVYFCCTEALQNVAKHVGPHAQVKVRVDIRHRVLQFLVSDNGPGCDAKPSGHGIANMRDRVRALDGDLDVTSTSGGGTTVLGWLTL